MAKILISLDERLVARIDEMARSRGESRSAYFARLAESDLERRSTRRRHVTRITFDRLDRLFLDAGRSDPSEVAEQIRAERDAR